MGEFGGQESNGVVWGKLNTLGILLGELNGVGEHARAGGESRLELEKLGGIQLATE
jgi:hypothetical protein